MNVIVGVKFAFNVFRCCLLAYSCPKCHHLRIALHIEGFADIQWRDLHLECGCRCWDLVQIILQYVISLININSIITTKRRYSWVYLTLHDFFWLLQKSWASISSLFLRSVSVLYWPCIHHSIYWVSKIIYDST